MFGMGSLDPNKLRQVQQISQNIKGEITVNYTKKTINIKFISTNEAAENFVDNLLGQFSETLATQLSSFFKIKGEIIEVGKD